MKRLVLCLVAALMIITSYSQGDEIKAPNAMIYKLSDNDSLIYYQCMVKTASLSVTTTEGSFTAAQQTITVTEKFVIIKQDTVFRLKYYISGFTAFPNRKFSGLKLKERDYWKFQYCSERILNKKELFFLATLQQTGRPTTEYDFAITKHTLNQVIIKHKKTFDQILPLKNISVSKVLNLTGG